MKRSPSKFRVYTNTLLSILKNRLGILGYPSISHFIVTWRCNLRCKTCNVWKRKESIELSMPDLEKVISQITFLDVVKITGGEPFVRDDIDKIVDLVLDKVNPYLLQINTNGTFTDKVLYVAEKYGMPSLQFRVSIDGREETHDGMRGVKGTFKKAYKTLLGLSQLKKEKGFSVGVNFNISDETINDMEYIRDMCSKLGVSFVPGFPVTPFLQDVGSNKNEKQMRVIHISNKEFLRERLNEILKSPRKDFPLIERLFLKRSNERIFDKFLQENPNFKFRCLELRSLMYLLPNGDLVTCGLDHKKVGNLLEEDFDSIWFSKKADEFRKRVDACKGCMQSAIEIFSRIYWGEFF